MWGTYQVFNIRLKSIVCFLIVGLPSVEEKAKNLQEDVADGTAMESSNSPGQPTPDADKDSSTLRKRPPPGSIVACALTMFLLTDELECNTR